MKASRFKLKIRGNYSKKDFSSFHIGSPSVPNFQSSLPNTSLLRSFNRSMSQGVSIEPDLRTFLTSKRNSNIIEVKTEKEVGISNEHSKTNDVRPSVDKNVTKITATASSEEIKKNLPMNHQIIDIAAKEQSNSASVSNVEMEGAKPNGVKECIVEVKDCGSLEMFYEGFLRAFKKIPASELKETTVFDNLGDKSEFSHDSREKIKEPSDYSETSRQDVNQSVNKITATTRGSKTSSEEVKKSPIGHPKIDKAAKGQSNSVKDLAIEGAKPTTSKKTTVELKGIKSPEILNKEKMFLKTVKIKKKTATAPAQPTPLERSAPPAPPVTGKEKTVLCRYFARGYCRKGEKCTYIHDESERKSFFRSERPKKEEKSCHNPKQSPGKKTESVKAASKEPIVKIKKERDDFDLNEQQATRQESKRKETSTVIFASLKTLFLALLKRLLNLLNFVRQMPGNEESLKKIKIEKEVPQIFPNDKDERVIDLENDQDDASINQTDKEVKIKSIEELLLEKDLESKQKCDHCYSKVGCGDLQEITELFTRRILFAE